MHRQPPKTSMPFTLFATPRTALALLGLVLPPLAAHALEDAPGAGGRVDVTPEEVAAHYVSLAHAGYVDALEALEAAQVLHHRITEFLEVPDEARMQAAKRAWLDAHLVYSRTEALRFGNPNVDAWESSVNAWPMDEGLIDYVAGGYIAHEGNPYAEADLINRGTVKLTDELIGELQGGTDPKSIPNAQVDLSDIETNVTRGYHAIEFLLWGQDRNHTPASCGERPPGDYATGATVPTDAATAGATTSPPRLAA